MANGGTTIEAHACPSAAISLPPPRTVRAGWWRALSILAGLALFATFFLPLGELSNWPDGTPLEFWTEFRQSLRAGAGSVLNLLAFCLIFAWLEGMPHLLGLVLALHAAGCLAGWTRLCKAAHCIGATIGLTAGSAFVGLWLCPWCCSQLAKIPARGFRIETLWSIVFMLIGIFLLAHALVALRRKRWSWVYHGVMATGSQVVVYSQFFSVKSRYFGWTGVTLSFLAVCLLLIARLGEAQAVSGVAWWRLSWRLVRLNLHADLTPTGHCIECGYDLRGLPECRCPECGQPFTPALSA